MNRYTVDWAVHARRELAKLWLATTDRNAITRASAEIDVRLAHDPAVGTVALSEGLMRIDVPPLAAYFAVDEVHRTIQVSWVTLRGQQ